MAEIKIPISVELANALPKLKQLTGELDKVGNEAQTAVGAVGNIGQAANKITDAGPKSFKTALKEANAELFTAVQQFGAGSAAAQDAAKKVAELKDNIGDAKLLTDAFNPDAKFTAFANAIKGVTGAFAAVQGAQALFGSESKAVEQALLKVQGALALSQGINSILESKDAFIALGAQLGLVRKAKVAANAADAVGTTVMVANTVATEAGAVAEAELAVATTGAAGAMGVLRTALIATGIGAVVVALGLLVANFDTISEKITGVNAGTRAFDETVKDLQKGLSGAYEETNKVRVAFQLARDGVISKKEALKTYNDTLGDSFGKTNDINEAEKKFNAGAETYIKIVGLKAQANALYAKAAEAAAKGSTAGLEDQVALFDKVIAGAKIFFGDYSGGLVKVAKSQKEGIDDATKKYKAQENAINAVADGLAKQAAELEKTSGIKVGGQIDPVKAKKDVETVAEVLRKLKEQIDGIKRVGFEFDTSTSKEQIAAFTETIKKLRFDKKLNLQVTEDQIQNLKDKITFLEFGIKLKAEIDIEKKEKLQEKRNEIERKLNEQKPIPLKANLRIEGDLSQSLNVASAIEERSAGLSDKIAEIMTAGFQESLAAFGQGLGDAITGAGSLGDAFMSGLSALGGMIQQIGKEFITIAVSIKAIKQFIIANPAVGIIGGVALIAAGAALKNISTRKLATGGFVSGPGSATSDSIPAMLSNGEFVINAASVKRFGVGFMNKLNNGVLNFATGGMVSANQIMAPIIQGDFGQMIPYIASTEIKGQDLRIVLNRANTRFNNTN